MIEGSIRSPWPATTSSGPGSRPVRSKVFHEIITGTLNAGVFPQHEMDPTFRPRRLFRG